MELTLMCYTGGPRCPSSAKNRLEKAKEQGDETKIKEARVDWFTTTPGIDQLRDRGRDDAADRFQERRDVLIDRSRVLDRQAQGLTIGIDLDNTTGDFTGGFRTKLAEKYGLTEEESVERYPEPADYELDKSGWFEDRDEFMSEMREAEDKGMYSKMKIFPGARKGIRELSDQGYSIHFVTARPDKFNDDTKESLRNWKLGYDSLVHEGTKQNYEPAHVFIDDAPYQIESLSLNGKGTITYHQEYNTHVDGPRSADWVNIPNKVDSHFNKV